MEILAELQHIGAATCLIDFSRSVLVALWIACQKSSKELQEDGKVCAIRSRDSDGTPRFNEISHDLVKEDIGYFFKPNEMGKYPIYQWTPKPQNNRIITQHSVFIFGRPKIDADFACVIKEENKQAILRDLELLFNIDEARMFPDLHGFAQGRAHDKCRSTLFPQDYLRYGFKAEERGDFDDAIRYYSNVIELNPTGSHFTFRAYSDRGRIYGVQGKPDKAIEDYTRAIGIEPNSVLNYNNRGAAYQEQGNLDQAIEGYTKAIELNPDNALAYENRGEAHQLQDNNDLSEVDLRTAEALRGQS